MLISVSGMTDTKFRAAAKLACEYYLSLLLPPRFIEKITIDIEFAHKLDGDADGYCEVIGNNERGKPREFLIQIRKNKSKRYMMMTLAHECVHAKQYAMGEITENMNTWKGKRVPASTDYWDQPWEIEAHGREYGLFARFAKTYKTRYRRTRYERDN